MDLSTNESIILDNLREIFDKKEILNEELHFHIQELATEIGACDLDPYLLKDAVNRFVSHFPTLENPSKFYSILADFLKIYFEKSEISFLSMLGFDDTHPITKTYAPKNSFTEKSFLCFSQHFSEMRFNETADYSEACMKACKDEEESAIFPIFSQQNGVLQRFLSYLVYDGLHIISKVRLKDAIQNDFLEYILVSKIPMNQTFNTISLYLQNDTNSLSTILAIAENKALRFEQIQTMEQGIFLTFTGNVESMELFLIALFCFTNHFTILGLYFTWEGK